MDPTKLFDPNLPYDCPALIGPGKVYLTGEDQLELLSCSGIGAPVLQVSGRMLRPNGEIDPFAQTFPAIVPGATIISRFQVGDGWLLGLSVQALTAGANLGQQWAAVRIVRGELGARTILHTLVQGTVSQFESLTWPWSLSIPSVDRNVGSRLIVGTNPAAGAEISETVPTNSRWRLVGISATLVTAVAVANRIPRLEFLTGASPFAASIAPVAQAASLTKTYFWSLNVQADATVSTAFVTLALPGPAWLETGFGFRTQTEALQAADDWSAPTYYMEHMTTPTS